MPETFGWVYTDKVKDHFTNPRNILTDGDDFKADGVGLVGNKKCGDEMMLHIKVDAASDTITDCRWKTYGCASAIASTSVLSEMVKGMRIDKAFALTPKDVVAELGQLPEHKIHCSVLGDKALRAAINDYFRTYGMEDRIREETARTVCQCMDVSDLEIENAVLEGVRTLLELQEHTKLGTVCGQCKEEAGTLMRGYIDKHFGGSSEK